MNVLVLIDKYVELCTRCTELAKNKDISKEKEEELSKKYIEANETLGQIDETISGLSTLDKFRLIDVLNAKMKVISENADNRLVENSKREIYYYALFVNKIREDLSRQSLDKKTK